MTRLTGLNQGALLASMSSMMPQQMVGRLLTLAHDSSENGRLQLVTELVDLFSRQDIAMEAREQYLVNEIVDALVANAQTNVRQQLAERVAPSATAPRKLILTLAHDDIAVARPVLRSSPILTDSDLISLIATQGLDHARTIAVRDSVSEALADALVVTGDIDVMLNLAENLGAKLSPKAMSAMVQAARFAEKLCQPLLERPDMSKENASQLYWWVAPELRRFALQRFGVEVGQIDHSLEQTVDDLLARYALDKNEDQVMVQVADWLMQRDIKSPKCLVQILRLGHFRLFSIMLGRVTGLSLELADIIVREMGGRSLAVACRALGLEKAQFVSVFLLSRGARADEQIVPPRELNNALLAFDRLNQPVAQQLIETWQRDPSYLLDRARQSGNA
jgi:uncharacterized protein (DUF2336 family)